MKKSTSGIVFDVSEFDGQEPLPIDTLVQRISATNARVRAESSRPRQCPSTLTSGKRTVTTVFCSLDEGHDGEHRGYRKRWPNEKKGAAT